MKRHSAILAALSLAGGALVILWVLVAGVGPLPTALARTVAVDATNDWITTFPMPPVNNGHVMRNASYEGEFIWNDAAGDERTDFANPDPRVDITELRITGDDTNLYFLVQMSDIDLATGDGAPQVQIAIDVDRVTTSGEPNLGGLADTVVHADAEWEYLIMTRFGSANSDVIVWQGGFVTQIFTGTESISTTTELIEIAVPWSALNLSNPPVTPLRFTVATFRANTGDNTWDIGGGSVSNALDAVTALGGNTWDEVSDGVVNYYFDVYFEPDGDPTSPLQISEVYYDLGAADAQTEMANEFVELYNPAQYLTYLDGLMLGDDPDGDPPEAREANFQFPGSPLTGTTYIVNPGEYVVVAVDARTYDDDDTVFPDFYWADWELNQGIADEFNNPDVMDLSRVYGLSATPVVSNQFVLSNGGDNVVLGDGTWVTGSLAISHTVLDGMNYEGFGFDLAPADTGIADADVAGGNPVATFGFSLQRDYTRANPDVNNSATDFEPDAVPTPGFAKGLIDHAIYKKGPTTVAAGDVFTYFLYYQIAGQPAPSVVVTDILPTNVQFITYTASSPITLTASTEPTLTWDLGNVPASTVGKITVTVQLPPDAPGGVLTQTAYIGSQSTAAEGITTNDAFALVTTALAPDLVMTKTVETARTPVHLGDPITYTVVVANRGDLDAAGVHITDTLPAAVTGSDLDQTVTISADNQVAFTIAATVSSSIAFYDQTVTNTAYFTHSSRSGSDDASFAILTPDIQITSPLDGAVFTATNGVSVTIPITVATGDFIIPDDGHWHLWVDGTMVGPVMDYSTTTDLLTGTHVISAELRSPTHEVIGPVDTITVNVTIIPPAPLLGINKTVETARTPVHLGDVVTYTVRIANNGAGTATSVVMTDALPAGISFGGWVDQGSAMLPAPGDTITWGPWDIASGQAYTFGFTATVDSDLNLYGQTITNTAEYNSANGGSGSDDASLAILTPGIQITSPLDGAVFTATNGVSVTIPITVATGDFIIPDDGHWHLWVDGTMVGPVMDYSTTTDLLTGTHVISAELRSPTHEVIGPVDTITVNVNAMVQEYTIFLPLLMRNNP